MCAAHYGHLNVVELLVERGAEMDTQDKVGTKSTKSVLNKCGYLFRLGVQL